MIHVTRNRRPELVIFGPGQQLQAPLALNAGNQIMITSLPSGDVSVAKYTVNEADQKRIVSTKLDEIIRAVTELGGTYPDIVQALQEAKETGALSGRFEIDALPTAGRRYHRSSGEEVADPSSPSDGDLFAEVDAQDRTYQRRTSTAEGDAAIDS